MRKLSKNVIWAMAWLTLFNLGRAYGQVEEMGNMVAAGAADAKKLLQPYVAPAVNAFGASLSGGWYNTAEPHKLGGFDITFTLNSAIISDKYKTFDINNSELSQLKLQNPSENTAPSIAGEKESGPQIVYNVKNGNTVVYTQPAFTMPEGLNLKYVPSPMIQLGVGLIKGTDVMFRFLPNLRYKGNELGLWGIGGRHDIKQWIPGLKNAPVFKMSLMYGYTKLHTFVDMDIDKNTIGASALPGQETNPWDDQKMTMYVRSQTANLILAADLKVITFYGGIGFASTKTTLKFEGDYPMVEADGLAVPTVVAITDPIDMEIKDGGATKARLNVGFRLKLAIVTLHFDYTYANYSVLTGGLGFSFR